MKRGFSLIETLVATAIIIMAAVGPLALAGRSLAQANYIKDQIVATFLAQEGLEIMRNIRDVNGVAGISALQSGTCVNGCTVDGTAVVQPSGKTYAVTAAANDPDSQKLTFNHATNIYSYNTDFPAVDSIYSRTIKIEALPGGKEFRVHSVVRWTRVANRTIELTENLFDRTW